MTSDPAAIARRSPWILSGGRDLLLVVATPFLVLPLIHGASWFWSPAQITTFAIVMAMGHHLPGFLRAYGDRELFRRFRTRFVAAPIVLLAVMVPASVLGWQGPILVTSIWGWWHYMAQCYGFGRIYDGRLGQHAARTARLDKALCFAWFFGAAVLNPNATFGFFELALRSGLPVPTADTMETLRSLTAGALAFVTAAYGWHAFQCWRRGEPQSPVKLVLFATTFAFVWSIASVTRNALVAYALFEVFHDIQYLTIVWAFNRARVARGQEFGGVSQFLFRSGGIRVAAYVGICAVYGLVDLGFKQVPDDALRSGLLGLFATSTLLHYYFDGFIWRLRDGSTASSLGIDAGGTPAWHARPAVRLRLPARERR